MNEMAGDGWNHLSHSRVTYHPNPSETQEREGCERDVACCNSLWSISSTGDSKSRVNGGDVTEKWLVSEWIEVIGGRC